MKLVLADVQSIKHNRSEVLPRARADNGGFNDLMERHLTEDADLSAQVEYPQHIDIKEVVPDEAVLLDAEATLAIGVDGSQVLVEDLDAQGLASPAVLDTSTGEIYKIEKSVQVRGSVEPAPTVLHHGKSALGGELPDSGKALPPEEIRLNQRNIVPLAVLHEPSNKVEANLLRGESANSGSAISSERQPLPRSFDIVGMVKSDLPAEKFSFTRGPEYQVISHSMLENADTNNAQVRTLASINAGISSHQVGTTLPPQLETMNVSNARDTGAWGQGLGERINWMVNQKLNTATIRMDPPMLGRLEVQILVSDEATNVTINTQHAQTREMIENASFRLREFLQESGYQNVNVDVSHQQDQQQASEQADGDNTAEGDEPLAAQDADARGATQGDRYFSSDSIVDYFA